MVRDCGWPQLYDRDLSKDNVPEATVQQVLEAGLLAHGNREDGSPFDFNAALQDLSPGTFGAAFARGVLCNWLVCMAVWMATSQKDLISKAAAVFFPISGFVAMGLDHSVANMFLIPFGIFCGAEITWADMVMKNLVPVTLGNLVGGAVFVAAAYHSAYGK